MRKDRCGWSCKVISFMAYLSWRRSEIAKQSKGKITELVSLLVSQRNLTSWDMPNRSCRLHNCLSPFSCFNKQRGGLQTTEIYFSQLQRLGSSRSRSQQIQCPVRICFLVHGCVSPWVLTCWEGQQHSLEFHEGSIFMT